jgi:UDP-N-acetylglucosamine 2-epimerase (non-hydrolysing)
MNALSILNIVGCRPNFIKIAPLIAEMRKHPEIRPMLLHTGQHHDGALSDVFFRDLDLPEPDIFLNIGSGSHARQTAKIIDAFEGVLLDLNPDLVLVVGDVNSTMACSITAVKLGFPVAHVEAGLRSFDREMPEEINRIVTDSVSDLLFASERSALRNLEREGISRHKVFFAGNVMIDTLMMNAEKIAHSNILTRMELLSRSFALVTLHRPSNVDDEVVLQRIVEALQQLQRSLKVVFPVHPRTAANLRRSEAGRALAGMPNVLLTEPLGYIDFTKLMRESLFVVTDSGGVQEESTALGVPCLTSRDTTERPVTVSQGTNRLVGANTERIVAEATKILNGSITRGRTPDKWDGHASARVVETLLKKKREIKQLYKSVRRRRIWPDVSSAA